MPDFAFFTGKIQKTKSLKSCPQKLLRDVMSKPLKASKASECMLIPLKAKLNPPYWMAHFVHKFYMLTFKFTLSFQIFCYTVILKWENDSIHWYINYYYKLCYIIVITCF